MKYIIHIVAFLCFVENTDAQHYDYVNVYNSSQKNTLYDLYYNKLIITGDSIYEKWRQFTFSGEGLEIIKDTTVPILFVKITNRNKLQLKIYRNGNNVAIYKFRSSDNVPLPKLQLSKVLEESGKSKRLDWDSIFYRPYFTDEYNSKIKFHLLSFVVSFNIDGRIAYTEFNCGNKFSKKIVNEGKKLKLNDKIILQSVVMADEFGNIYIVPSEEFVR